MYSGTTNNFQTLPIDGVIKNVDTLTSPLQEFVKNHWIRKGYTIQILSEIGKGHSLGFTGTFPAVLSALFHLLSEDITEADLSDYQNFLSSDGKDSIFQFSWKLGLYIRRWRTFGQTAMHTIYGTSTPALYTVKTVSEKLAPEEIMDLPTHFSPFDEFSPECGGHFEIPLEYALIFSGIPSEAFRLEHSKEADIRKTNGLSDFIHERIFGNIPIDGLYYEKLLKNTSPYTILSDAMGILNIVTIEMFHKMFLSGYNEVLVEQFLEHMNHLREILSVVEPQGDFANSFMNIFHNQKTHPGESIGIFPMYSGKLGWGYVVGIKPGMSRETFYHTCDKLKEQYPQIEIDYFSPADWEKSSWLIIEQDIYHSRFSSLLPEGQVRYISTNGKSCIGDYNKILDEQKEGIVFDTITRKIYFLGEKLTSEDVPSQTTIVDIMNILVDRMGEDIGNNEFPLSSYMKNKNEMLGKIVIPLIRFLEKKTGMILPLVCKGEIGTFYLKLNSSQISIGVIRKI